MLTSQQIFDIAVTKLMHTPKEKRMSFYFFTDGASCCALSEVLLRVGVTPQFISENKFNHTGIVKLMDNLPDLADKLDWERNSELLTMLQHINDTCMLPLVHLENLAERFNLNSGVLNEFKHTADI